MGGGSSYTTGAQDFMARLGEAVRAQPANASPFVFHEAIAESVVDLSYGGTMYRQADFWKLDPTTARGWPTRVTDSTRDLGDTGRPRHRAPYGPPQAGPKLEEVPPMRHTAPLSLLGWAALGSLLFALAACDGQAVIESTDAIRETGADGHSELMYLLDPEDVASRFEMDHAAFEPSRAFRLVELMLEVEGDLVLEYQVALATGWSDWVPVTSDAPERFRAARLELPSAASALRLRYPEGLRFARLEFFSTLQPEGVTGFDDDPYGAEGHDDLTTVSGEAAPKDARAGRWSLPAATRDAARGQYVAYTGAPSWNRGRNCGGGLSDGARRLGAHLVDLFDGARYYQGYACRRIRGGRGMSVHGTGRALDVFVPLDGGRADNDLGDPVANYLVENAETIGVQLVIWDRTIWNGSRRGDQARAYGGAHPHHDHLHIELTPAAGRLQTPFFSGTPPPRADTPPPSDAECHSATLGRRVPHGECVQMAYARCGGTCNWAACADGAWVCADPAACEERHTNSSCDAPEDPSPRGSCASHTLDREVPDASCVQMPYDACGGACRWARCDDGAWTCVDPGACPSDSFPHAECAGGSGRECYSRTLGRSVDHGGRVQMAYEACGGVCRWARCVDGDWDCTGRADASTSFPHARCQ